MPRGVHNGHKKNSGSFGSRDKAEVQEMYERRSNSSAYIVTRTNSVDIINARRNEDPSYNKEIQDKATKGKLESEVFAESSRNTLKRLREDPEIEERRKTNVVRGLRGTVWGRTKSVPTVYSGVKFKCLSEARLAEWLNSVGLSWTYEGFVLPTILKDGKKWRYNPDFYILDHNELLEVKGWNFEGLRETLDEVERQHNIRVRILTSDDIFSLPGETSLLDYRSSDLVIPQVLQDLVQRNSI